MDTLVNKFHFRSIFLRISFLDFGHVKIKEIIRTLEANSRNSKIASPKIRSSRCFSSVGSSNSPNNHIDSTIRQRPLSQPCTRTETNALLTTNHHHRQFGTTTDDAKLLSSTTKRNSPPPPLPPPSSSSSSSCLNNSHRSDVSVRSITK